MNTLVAFDSQFGNTEKIAKQIAEILGEFGTARAMRVEEIAPEALDTVDLLVVGCPTQGWQSTPAMKAFLARLDPSNIKRLFFAEFDTRFDKPKWLTGSAAGLIEKQLTHLQAMVLTPPVSFFVRATEGPLADGELERAAQWAHTLHDEFEIEMEAVAMLG